LAVNKNVNFNYNDYFSNSTYSITQKIREMKQQDEIRKIIKMKKEKNK
jgi:hypothetical protein